MTKVTIDERGEKVLWMRGALRAHMVAERQKANWNGKNSRKGGNTQVQKAHRRGKSWKAVVRMLPNWLLL